MSLNPIPKALSTFLHHKIKALLIGGQACILYGAAEFSRDIDLAVMVSSENLEGLKEALKELGAERVFYPALLEEELLREETPPKFPDGWRSTSGTKTPERGRGSGKGSR